MRLAIEELWGCGTGPLRRLTPVARLVSGGLVLGACLVTPPSLALGTLQLGLGLVLWISLSRPPVRVILGGAAMALTMLLPFAVVGFFGQPLEGIGSVGVGFWGPLARLEAPWALPWTLLARGGALVLISLACVASLTQADVLEGLARLPIPGVLAALLGQIVRQTTLLAAETRQIAAALAVRGATRGLRSGLQVLVALPKVWLPRVVARAERVANAMELRALGAALPRFREQPLTLADALATTAGVAWLGLGVALRVLS